MPVAAIAAWRGGVGAPYSRRAGGGCRPLAALRVMEHGMPGRGAGYLARATLRLAVSGLAAGAIGIAGAARAQDASPAPQVIAKSGDWTVYAHAGPPRLCFVLSSLKDGDAKAPARGLMQVFVSAWPEEGVRAEVSIKSASPFRSGSDVSVTIGPQVFRLFSAGDRAWVGDATLELKLLEAMRKGNRMAIQGVGNKGVPITDSVSLAGLGQALLALMQGCK